MRKLLGKTLDKMKHTIVSLGPQAEVPKWNPSKSRRPVYRGLRQNTTPLAGVLTVLRIAKLNTVTAIQYLYQYICNNYLFTTILNLQLLDYCFQTIFI